MKRSEMVELMARILEKNFDFDNGNWTDDAEKLLDQMEYVGMLPPKGHSRYFYIPEVKTEYTNEWDEE